MEILIGTDTVIVDMDSTDADSDQDSSHIRYRIQETTEDGESVINVVEEDLTENAFQALQEHEQIALNVKDPFPAQVDITTSNSADYIKAVSRISHMNLSRREKDNYPFRLREILREEIPFNLEFAESGRCEIVGVAGVELTEPIVLQEEPEDENETAQ
jgi:hypothetical protein